MGVTMFESSFIGKSSAIKRLLKEIPHLAKLQSHILIIGDKGTGRTTLATLIHSAARRAGKFTILHPTSSTEEEMKAFLEREPKNIATIVFQEIEDFSFLYQSKINQFINTKKPFVRVILTAKNDIDRLKSERKLLEDLYATLSKCEQVAVPTLRERREDIPLLVEYFLKTACESMNTQLKAIDVNTMDFLVRREWKGNVRELKSTIESTVLTSQHETVVLPPHLVDEHVQLDGIVKNISQKEVFSFDQSLSNLEKTLIEKTLEAVDHNQTRAAQILNLSEANLRYRLKKFHIMPARQK